MLGSDKTMRNKLSGRIETAETTSRLRNNSAQQLAEIEDKLLQLCYLSIFITRAFNHNIKFKLMKLTSCFQGL